MISSSYKLHRQETAKTFDLEPSGWRRIPVLVWLPQEDDEVGVTRQLLHTLSAFSADVVDLLPERKSLQSDSEISVE